LRINLRPAKSQWSLRGIGGNPSLSVIVLSTVITIMVLVAALLISAAVVSGPYPNILGIAILACCALFQVFLTRSIAKHRRNKSGR